MVLNSKFSAFNKVRKIFLIWLYKQKDFISKTVHLSNFYHPELSLVIELINGIVPEKYEMNYDKANLIQGMKNCEKFKNAE